MEICNRLENLCIEFIGKNIVYYGRCYRQIRNRKWEKCHGALGEKILYSSISNSWCNGFDENCLQFIFDKFCIQSLKIGSRFSEKIKFFDFLHQNYIKNLEIILCEFPLKIKNRKFNLKVDDLILSFSKGFSDDYNLLESNNFLSNLHVKKSIKFFIKTKDDEFDKNLLDKILKIIENSSENINYVFLKTNKVNRKFFNVLKKYSKNLEIKYSLDMYSKSIPNFIEFSPIIKNVTSLGFGWVLKENFENTIEILKSATSLTELKIKISFDLEKTENLFREMTKFNSKILKKLDLTISIINQNKHSLINFLNSCEILEYVFIKNTFFAPEVEIDIFKALKTSSKTLISLSIENLIFNSKNVIQSFEHFFSTSKLEKFILDGVHFEENILKNFLKNFEKIGNQLTSLTLTADKIGEEEIELLSYSLIEFTKLKEIRITGNHLLESKLMNLCRSFKSSSKTIESFFVESNFPCLHDPNNLFELFEVCTELKFLNIQVKLNEKDCWRGLNILKKFQDKLVGFSLQLCFSQRYKHELGEFLFRCKNLEYLYINCLPSDIWKFYSKYLMNKKYSIEKIYEIYEIDQNKKLLHKFSKAFLNNHPDNNTEFCL